MLYVARNEQDCQAGHVVFSSALTTRTGVRRSAFLVNSFARSLTANECNARWLAVCHATVVLVVTAGRRACPVRRPHSHRTASRVAAVAGLPVVAYYRDTLFAADAHLDGRGRRRNKAWDGRAAVWLSVTRAINDLCTPCISHWPQEASNSPALNKGLSSSFKIRPEAEHTLISTTHKSYKHTTHDYQKSKITVFIKVCQTALLQTFWVKAAFEGLCYKMSTAQIMMMSTQKAFDAKKTVFLD